LIVSLDQEGGLVARLRGLVTDLPPMRDLGSLRDARLCADLGEMMGDELASLGFNVDYAPVMDVDTNPENPVIASRAFSDDPDAVAQLAGAFATGLLVAGVVPCVKHFPGHGDTSLDSHVDLPVLDCNLSRLESVELIPFRGAVRAGLPLLMTAHIVVSALNPDHPASLSRAIVTDLLRDDMGYQGVVITDDLEMAAVAQRFSIAERVTLALMAGVDLFLICHTADDQSEARAVLIKLAESAGPARDRLFESAGRVEHLRRTHLRPFADDGAWRDVVGGPRHRALVRRLHRRLVEG
jgi:beta-N-acetylhexosaminidase